MGGSVGRHRAVAGLSSEGPVWQLGNLHEYTNKGTQPANPLQPCSPQTRYSHAALKPATAMQPANPLQSCSPQTRYSHVVKQHLFPRGGGAQ